MCDEYFTLHDLPQEDRPRERLKEVGVDKLSIQELLALIVEKGRKGESVLAVSQHLLARFGNLAKLKEASVEELMEVKGIGFATACKLKAALKLGEKALNTYNKYEYEIKGPKAVFDLLKNELGNKKKEHFKILSLTTRKTLISIDNVSIGILDSSLAHPREVFKTAIQNSAASIILVHNHPSGDPTPSNDDIKMTERLIEAGKIMGIEIDDHVIIADRFFASLRSDIKTSGLWRKK